MTVIENRLRYKGRHTSRIATGAFVPKSLLNDAADEIERLQKAINDAIDYCYKFEREHEAGHLGIAALIPIQQDLQAAVGR